MLGSGPKVENSYNMGAHLDQLDVNWLPLEFQCVSDNANMSHSVPNGSFL